MHIRKLLIWFLTMVLVISCCSLTALATDNVDANQPTTQSDDATWWDKIKDKAGDIADTIRDKAPGVIDSAKEGASNLYDSAKEKVPELVDKAKEGITNAGEAFNDFREGQEDQFWNWFDNQTSGGNTNPATEPNTDGSNAGDQPTGQTPDEPANPPESTQTPAEQPSNAVPQENGSTIPDPDANTNLAGGTDTNPADDANAQPNEADVSTDSSVNAAEPAEAPSNSDSSSETEPKEAPLWVQILWISPIFCLAGSCIFCGYTLYRMYHPRGNKQSKPGDHQEDDHKNHPNGRYVKPKR